MKYFNRVKTKNTISYLRTSNSNHTSSLFIIKEEVVGMNPNIGKYPNSDNSIN